MAYFITHLTNFYIAQLLDSLLQAPFPTVRYHLHDYVAALAMAEEPLRAS